MSNFNLLFSEIGAHIGMESLAFGEDNTCSLEFDENIVLTFIDSDPSLFCVAYLGEWDGVANTALRLLEANFAWQETSGGTLAIEPGSVRVVLSRTWQAQGLTMQGLMGDIENMVSAAERCQALLTEQSGAVDQPASSPGDPLSEQNPGLYDSV